MSIVNIEGYDQAIHKKKNCLLYPYLPTFHHPTQNFFLVLFSFKKKMRLSHFQELKG